MSLFTMDVARSPLARVNPVAKLAATLAVSVTLLLSIDPVSAGVALAATLVLLPFARLPARAVWLRLWPIVVAALIAGAGTVLYGRASGEVFFHWGLVRVSEGSLDLAIAIVLRVLAIAVPSVLLFATTDPTDLADGLAQVLRLPARFVLGALAGLRLVGLLVADWRELGMARRARGVADRGRIRRFLGQAFALLVLAIRRGTKLATAMEARGFGARGARSWARPSRLGWRDAVLVAIAIAVAAASVVAAVIAGTWTLVFAL
ncbi:energy-coupling factor transporter transmembrane protein EcfT [Microbacterium sp. SORGH_AS_0888]|uniref:energy-coupling factor transporter transmembrane component T family protein n=1 Tax=Microbacterium sp. SORGH_AS_0888 TaxID=3041791 RepID=UPI002781E3AB|nr:energy-coupling factor transporter transmembrane component T [Microbacterium sp. SORGH_AS_0888]MDQ1129526.1 energy-coupling factor transport system permease protein [Microbacterium sp. SORGH_AS_0888]